MISSPSDNTKGFLASMVAGGIPRRLALSVAPPLAHGIPPKNQGKQPALPAPDGQGWIPLSKWQGGITDTEFLSAETNKANAGLLCGVVHDDVQFVCIDIDTNTGDGTGTPEDNRKIEGATALSRFIVEVARDHLKTPLWVRESRPGRAAILLPLPASTEAGGKAFLYMSHAEFGELGKIELLAKGQQVVIAGVHPHGGRPIQWFRTDALDRKHVAPVFSTTDKRFTRDEINALLDVVAERMTAKGFKITRSSSSSASHHAAIDPRLQAAPSARLLIDTLNKMPNPVSLDDRQVYVNTRLATIGCLRALQKMGQCTPEEFAEGQNAFVAWACRWDSEKRSTWTQENEWFVNECERTPVIQLGWDYISNTATSLGVTDMRVNEAVESFPALGPMPKPDPSTLPPLVLQQARSVDDAIGPQRMSRGDTGSFVISADVYIADLIEEKLGSIAAWVEDQEKWIAWQGMSGGWAAPYGDRLVFTWIDVALREHVDRYMKENNYNEATLRSVLSAARIRAIEQILRARLGHQSDQVDKGHLHVQTPEGAYSLKTGKRLSLEDQRSLVERRMASAAPQAGEMPLFESVVSHLAEGRAEVIEWLWAYFGYILMGYPVGHCLLIMYGPGGNGKGTVGEVLMKILGTYALKVDRSIVLERGKNKHETAKNDLRGKRMWWVDEFEPGEKWNEADLRSMTGGGKIAARALYRDMQYFDPEGTFLMTANYMPSLYRVDNAIVRRFRVVNCRAKVRNDIKGFSDIIFAKEAPAIMHRLIQEASKIIANGYNLPEVPACMTREANRYFAEQDLFFGWFNAECEIVSETRGAIAIDDLKQRFAMYLKRRSEETDPSVTMDILSNKQFELSLRKHGALTETESGRVKAVDHTGKSVPGVVGVALKLTLVETKQPVVVVPIKVAA